MALCHAIPEDRANVLYSAFPLSISDLLMGAVGLKLDVSHEISLITLWFTSEEDAVTDVRGPTVTPEIMDVLTLLFTSQRTHRQHQVHLTAPVSTLTLREPLGISVTAYKLRLEQAHLINDQRLCVITLI